MRILITPLGSTASDGAATARRIVAYMTGNARVADRPLAAAPDTGGLVGYFGSDMEGSGIWLGGGAGELGLTGRVEPGDLESVLAARHPRTGERLVSSQGSAGRAHVAVGTVARFAANGESLYDLADAARLLRVPRATLAAMAHEGRLLGDLRPDTADWIATTTVDGRDFVKAAEIDRWINLTDCGIPPEAIERHPTADETVSAPHAARMIGVTPRYVRRLCRRYADDPDRYDSDDGTEVLDWIRCTAEPSASGDRNVYRITRSDLAEYVRRRQPPAVRCGFDLTLTTEKSFGILMMLGPPQVRVVCQRIFDDANNLAIGHLDRHAARTRAGRDSLASDGLTVASFLHGTSRALDPFPHRHNIVANTAHHNGDRRTLDARLLYHHAPIAAALATAQLRLELTRQLGVRWRPGRNGGWEINGIPDRTIDEFSTRRQQITLAADDLAHVLGHPATRVQVDAIALDTRTPKTHPDPISLVADWHIRAAATGLTPETLERCCPDPGDLTSNLTREVTDRLFVDLAGPHGLCATVNSFTRGDVIRALVDADIGTPDNPQVILATPEQIEALADEFVSSHLVIDLRTAPQGGRQVSEPRYSTVELLEHQAAVHQAFTTGLGADAGVVSDDPLAEALRQYPTLDPDQRHLVETFCQSGHRLQCAVGPPGSGKSTAMAAAAHAWEHAGYRVIGAAVKGEAARVLAAATGIETNTIAWYLTQHRHGHTTPFTDRTVFIVDEAGTLDDRTLHELTTTAENTGTALRLIGDPHQHGAVAAGGTYAALTRLHPDLTPQLTGNHRQDDPTEQKTSTLLRDRQIADALSHLRRAGLLQLADTEHDAYLHTLRRWWRSRQTLERHPMVDRLNATRNDLNRLAQHLRCHAGEIQTPVELPTGQRLAIGDEIVARNPARHLHPDGQPHHYIRNGSTGTITAITAETLTVDFDALGTISLPIPALQAPGEAHQPGSLTIELGYALTSYAVQGTTRGTSTSIVTPSSTLPEVYVNLTRGRRSNALVAVRPAEPTDDERHLPTLPPPNLTQEIHDHLNTHHGDTSAYEQDPHALERARRRDPSSGMTGMSL